MTSYTWILLLLAGLAATRAQELDLGDALDDEIPTLKPGVEPTPPKDVDPDAKKPAVVPPKSVDDKNKPALGGGGSFDDNDLFNVNEGGEYKPDGGSSGDKNKPASGGRGGDPVNNDQSGGGSESPQGGALAAIISSVLVAVVGAGSSYFAYQKKKLCFKMQGGEDPESGKSHGTQSEPQALSNLLRSS